MGKFIKRYFVDSTKWWFLISLFLTVVLYLTQGLSLEIASIVLIGLFISLMIISIVIQLLLLLMGYLNKKTDERGTN